MLRYIILPQYKICESAEYSVKNVQTYNVTLYIIISTLSPKTLSISSKTFSWQSGLQAKLYSNCVNPVAVVSKPAKKNRIALLTISAFVRPITLKISTHIFEGIISLNTQYVHE